ncbi:hypothetical protein RESH_06288 [Rhodopirellula europaea SH398]|uniref:Uncharacterized protein n=1 Tax=Rhodopirellula europaea SH398 TaxID=1263868 RepID=M5RUZ4_9BACT|nr:hypothetical protein RESH_06288 [Rhodopirellula europaea SH398]
MAESIAAILTNGSAIRLFSCHFRRNHHAYKPGRLDGLRWNRRVDRAVPGFGFSRSRVCPRLTRHSPA